MKTHISFRLRNELDADLIQLNIDEKDLPDLCRNGLRLILGIRTVKQIEITERPIHIPEPEPVRNPQIEAMLRLKEKTAQSPSRPAVFTSKPIRSNN